MSTEQVENQENQKVSEEASDPSLALAQWEARYKALEEEFLRFRAESENQRKRTLKDAENARKFGAEKLLQELLPVADTLLRGVEIAKTDKATVENLVEGKEATLRMLGKVLENNGVKELNPVGEIFNPELHQAMTMQPATEAFPANTVVQVMQRGFVLHERLLRPALVIVAQP